MQGKIVRKKKQSEVRRKKEEEEEKIQKNTLKKKKKKISLGNPTQKASSFLHLLYFVGKVLRWVQFLNN